MLDLNGDGDVTDSEELDEDNPLVTSPHFNEVNELEHRDIDDGGNDDYALTYDDVGNLIDDGQNYEYVYEAFGRLIQVRGESDQFLVAEYAGSGVNHRSSLTRVGASPTAGPAALTAPQPASDPPAGPPAPPPADKSSPAAPTAAHARSG